MILEIIFQAGEEVIKFRIAPDGSIYGASPKTGLENWIPHALVEEGIEEAKNREIDADNLEQAEEELMNDIEWLKEHSQEEIAQEMEKEMAKKGFKKIKKRKIHGNNI